MPAGSAAKRYAQAAFQLALEHDNLDQWAEDLSNASSAVANDELRTFLQHAKVPYPRKVSVIAEALPSLNPMARNLLALLVARGLVNRTSQIEQEYRRLLDQHRGRIQVEVTSAVPLDDGERQRITRLLESLVEKEVVLATRVDPAILGGLVLQVEDKLIDGSTRAKLNALGRTMASVTESGER